MATHPLWSEEYWILLLQIYFKKPAGIKRTYARPMVELSLELHIPPYILHEKMEEFDLNDLPSIQALWKAYANNPKKLQKEARRIRKMSGFGKPEEFYEGVTTAETFRKSHRPDTCCAHYSAWLVFPSHPCHNDRRDARGERSGTITGHNHQACCGNYGRLPLLRPLPEPCRPHDFATFAAVPERLGPIWQRRYKRTFGFNRRIMLLLQMIVFLFS